MVILQEETESTIIESGSEQLQSATSDAVETETEIKPVVDDDDEDIDETLYERLVGLTEMFPDIVQTGTTKLVSTSCSTIQSLFKFARSAAWIIFSTSAILVAPVIFEVERAQMEELQRQQQRQILLGPGAVVSGGAPTPGLAPAPRK